MDFSREQMRSPQELVQLQLEVLITFLALGGVDAVIAISVTHKVGDDCMLLSSLPNGPASPQGERHRELLQSAIDSHF